MPNNNKINKMNNRGTNSIMPDSVRVFEEDALVAGRPVALLHAMHETSATRGKDFSLEVALQLNEVIFAARTQTDMMQTYG
jgi:hypothetical protein